MTSPVAALASVSDDDLLLRLGRMVRDSRRIEADLVAHLAEVDARRLYAREACPSMFAYCTDRLGLSEPEAYLRISAARASREHPVLLAMLADGRLHLSGIALLARHLTPENRDAVLARAAGRSKRGVEALIAEIAPRPDATTIIRRLPAPARDGSSGDRLRRSSGPRPSSLVALCEGGPGRVPSSPAERPSPQVEPPAAAVRLRPDGVDDSTLKLCAALGSVPAVDCDRDTLVAAAGRRERTVVEPLSPGRYRIQFTASAELRKKLERLQALLRTAIPEGDLAAVIELAVDEKLRKVEGRRFGRTMRPRGAARADRAVEVDRDSAAAADESHPGGGASASGSDGVRLAVGASRTSRHVPATIRRAVRERDGDQCAYRDAQGRRCSARDRLEFHHRHPFGYGGSHSVDNVCLMCRAHNCHEAAADFGRDAAPRTERARQGLPAVAG